MIEENTGRVSPVHRSELTGTYAYRAPEVLRGEAPSTKADIYSLGVTLWQMTTRSPPYDRQNQHMVIFGVVAHHLRPALPATTPGNVKEKTFQDVYVKCWQARPNDRPGAQCVADKLRGWLKGVNRNARE